MRRSSAALAERSCKPLTAHDRSPRQTNIRYNGQRQAQSGFVRYNGRQSFTRNANETIAPGRLRETGANGANGNRAEPGQAAIARNRGKRQSRETGASGNRAKPRQTAIMPTAANGNYADRGKRQLCRPRQTAIMPTAANGNYADRGKRHYADRGKRQSCGTPANGNHAGPRNRGGAALTQRPRAKQHHAEPRRSGSHAKTARGAAVTRAQRAASGQLRERCGPSETAPEPLRSDRFAKTAGEGDSLTEPWAQETRAGPTAAVFCMSYWSVETDASRLRPLKRMRFNRRCRRTSSPGT